MPLMVFAGNSRLYGSNRIVVVAAKNKKEAAEIVGLSIHRFNVYWWNYSKDDDAKIALREPGKIFSKRTDRPDDKLVHTPNILC